MLSKCFQILLLIVWYLRPVGKWHSSLLTYVLVCQIHKLFERSIGREDSFVLCYLAYLPVVAFNGVGGVYQLTYRRCIPEVFREASSVVTPWLYDDGIRFPHFLSSASNCVSAVSLITVPYTVLRSRRNSLDLTFHDLLGWLGNRIPDYSSSWSV